MKDLIMAVPKGRILEELPPLLQELAIEDDFFNESSRKLVFETGHKGLKIIKVRSFDVASFVKFGAADLGICGVDVLEEFKSKEIFNLFDLGIGKCRLSLARPKFNSDNDNQIDIEKDLQNKSHVRIATKYVEIAKKYFALLNIQAECVKLNGSVEIAAKLGLCDYILDLVSTGNTLKANNMIEVKNILDVSSYLVANRGSFKTKNQEVNSILNLFRAS